ncbi:DNA polymerase III subunit epsilon [Streptomyces sp. WAC 06738]|uniref:exonuclease domain-containing protein n=1 Tax=Streptomyces sp. WAC 06738 TaxID=2203210 RepID=UPI000F6D91A3|nr:DNA polymerase III subunit epsilon [Streptomyces sp. WAC 06738]
MWHADRLAGFDLETTAPDPETARIVSACVIQCGGGQPTASAVWLSDVDGETIPREAEKIHGITTGIAHTQGQPLAEVVQEILAALTQVTLSGIPVVAMNARYDFTVLDREARRFGHPPLTDTAGGMAVVDPFVLDKHVDTYRRGSRKLTALCAHYDVPIGDAHSADADAIAACRVAWRIGKRNPRLAAMTPEELHTAQVGWAAEQAASLQEHFRKKDPAAVVEPAWPLVPAAGVGTP